MELTVAEDCGLGNALKKSVKGTEGPRNKKRKRRLSSRGNDVCVPQQGVLQGCSLLEWMSLDSPESSY